MDFVSQPGQNDEKQTPRASRSGKPGFYALGLPLPLIEARLGNAPHRSPCVYRIFRAGAQPYNCYVGSTTGRTDRAYYHYYNLSRGKHHSKHLQSAWNAYGSSAFLFEILEVTAVEFVRKAERRWMTYFAEPATELPRYNCSAEVDQPPHRPPTSATRAKWSRQRLGRKHTAEAKAKIAESSRGRRHSPETLQRMRLHSLGKRLPELAYRRSTAASARSFRLRVQIAKRWCKSMGIDTCRSGSILIMHLARCLSDGKLRLGDRLPATGALAKALKLSHATVSLALRRRAPIINGLTIGKSGAGLVVKRADQSQTARSVSFYAKSTASRISTLHRQRGIQPGTKCREALAAYNARVRSLKAPNTSASGRSKNV
jgi:group I intron endonuclease